AGSERRRRRARRGSSRPDPVGVGTRKNVVVQLGGSIEKPLVVPSARGRALPDKPFQVRECLRDGETALRRLQVRSEDAEGDLVGAPWLVAERRSGLVEPAPMMLDQLSGANAGVEDRLTMSGVDDPRRELDGPLERRQIVPERVRLTFRVETHRARNALQEMIPRDQTAVTEKAELSVGVTGQLQHLPAVQLAPFVEQVRFDGVTDERRERVTL